MEMETSEENYESQTNTSSSDTETEYEDEHYREKRKPTIIKKSVLDPSEATSREEWEEMIYSKIPFSGNKKKLITELNPGEYHLKKHLPLLLMLSDDVHGNQHQRHAIIETLDHDQLQAITKYMSDFLTMKHEKLPSDVIKKLKKDKDFIYALAHPEVSHENKKKLLKQKSSQILRTCFLVLMNFHRIH